MVSYVFFAAYFIGLQRMAKRLVWILLGHDGVQHRCSQDTSESGGSRTTRAVFLGPTRNIIHIYIYLLYNCSNQQN